MNVIAVNVRQAKGKANRLCISAIACLRSLSALASAANFDISCKDIDWRLPEPESLSILSSVFWLSANLIIDLSNTAVYCEDGGEPCALAPDATSPPYTSDTPLRSWASNAIGADDWPDSILNCPRSAVSSLEAPPGW